MSDLHDIDPITVLQTATVGLEMAAAGRRADQRTPMLGAVMVAERTVTALQLGDDDASPNRLAATAALVDLAVIGLGTDADDLACPAEVRAARAAARSLVLLCRRHLTDLRETGQVPA